MSAAAPESENAGNADWAKKPVRAPDEPPLFLHELIDAAPAGARVLDAGCGPGSWRYGERPELRIIGFDIKFPPGPPARAPHVGVLRADLARLPFRDGAFDLTLCHYVLEHVTELAACCDELARVTRPGGTLYLAVPRSASFDDRLYRFAGYFAKYALLKLGKRIEHQQRFDLEKLLALFEARGLEVESLAHVPAGFSWMNDPRTKPLQGPFTDALAGLHRATGIDLAADANLVATFRKTGARGVRRTPRLRRVTHVCRSCGEHSVLTPPAPAPSTWTCPWCGAVNPLGRPR
ncbi:MAG TPA: class I SAM-dependent methyltransferase [Candidatus Eisenbacteria bacterium]|nr:class I SAM-dependent methyltransferase [Candidatus Eisenbacteria bacterium]